MKIDQINAGLKRFICPIHQDIPDDPIFVSTHPNLMQRGQVFGKSAIQFLVHMKSTDADLANGVASRSYGECPLTRIRLYADACQDGALVDACTEIQLFSLAAIKVLNQPCYAIPEHDELKNRVKELLSLVKTDIDLVEKLLSWPRMTVASSLKLLLLASEAIEVDAESAEVAVKVLGELTDEQVSFLAGKMCSVKELQDALTKSDSSDLLKNLFSQSSSKVEQVRSVLFVLEFPQVFNQVEMTNAIVQLMKCQEEAKQALNSYSQKLSDVKDAENQLRVAEQNYNNLLIHISEALGGIADDDIFEEMTEYEDDRREAEEALDTLQPEVFEVKAHLDEVLTSCQEQEQEILKVLSECSMPLLLPVQGLVRLFQSGVSKDLDLQQQVDCFTPKIQGGNMMHLSSSICEQSEMIKQLMQEIKDRAKSAQCQSSLGLIRLEESAVIKARDTIAALTKTMRTSYESYKSEALDIAEKEQVPHDYVLEVPEVVTLAKACQQARQACRFSDDCLNQVKRYYLKMKREHDKRTLNAFAFQEYTGVLSEVSKCVASLESALQESEKGLTDCQRSELPASMRTCLHDVEICFDVFYGVMETLNNIKSDLESCVYKYMADNQLDSLTLLDIDVINKLNAMLKKHQEHFQKQNKVYLEFHLKLKSLEENLAQFYKLMAIDTYQMERKHEYTLLELSKILRKLEDIIGRSHHIETDQDRAYMDSQYGLQLGLFIMSYDTFIKHWSNYVIKVHETAETCQLPQPVKFDILLKCEQRLLHDITSRLSHVRSLKSRLLHPVKQGVLENGSGSPSNVASEQVFEIRGVEQQRLRKRRNNEITFQFGQLLDENTQSSVASTKRRGLSSNPARQLLTQ